MFSTWFKWMNWFVAIILELRVVDDSSEFILSLGVAA
jgi:hypothetical protein